MNVRVGTPSDQRVLEELQLRASLENPGDREHVLANPGAGQTFAITEEQFTPPQTQNRHLMLT